jgi:hypothetical protein
MDEQSYADIVVATGYHLKSVKSYIQNGKPRAFIKNIFVDAFSNFLYCKDTKHFSI